MNVVLPSPSGTSDGREAIDLSGNMLFAAELEAEYIISDDEKHVVPVGKYQGIVVLRPNEFLKLLEKERLIGEYKKAA